MKSIPTDEAMLLLGLLAVFVCRAVVASAVVPPWQGPDEPGHFAFAYTLTQPNEVQHRVPGAVIQSMVRYRWWALYDDPPPDPLPTSFESVPGIGGGSLAQPLYYVLGSDALRLSRPADLDAAYYHLRVLSVILAIVTLGFGWLGTRRLFGREVATGATAIAALHPQFLLVSLSVNPDALLNLCGAFAWWQAARVVTGHRRGLSALLMLVAALVAVFTKRIGMVLAGVAVVVIAASLLDGRSWRITWRHAIVAAVIVALGAVGAAAAAFLFREELGVLRLSWADAMTFRRPLDQATLAEAFRFGRMTVDYFWLIAGWLRFQPPDVWLWVARALILGGMAGATVALIESRERYPRLWVAWVFVIAQLAIMLIAVFWVAPSAPQARYLFPAFVPITVLLYVGLRRVVPRKFEAHWPAALVVLLLMLDVTGFTLVHVPTYIP
jgi:hypothetical protein